MSSEERFGYEWDKYSAIDPNYQLQFRRWVAPLTPPDFQDKTVLDAGCGMGRNSYWALRWGAEAVTAFDFDERSVRAARKNLQEFGDRARVIYKSIYDPQGEDEFDIVFSIGVIHHLEDPKAALANLVKATKPGGRLLIWVYSHEGNEWIVKVVDPVRKNITSKLPVGLVHFLSYFASIPLWTFVKTFRGPGAYLRQLAKFRFSHVHSIVFDQLIPSVASYWTKNEALGLLKDLALTSIAITCPESGTGWTVLGVKKQGCSWGQP